MSRFRFQLNILYVGNIRYSAALESLDAIGGYTTEFKHVELPLLSYFNYLPIEEPEIFT